MGGEGTFNRSEEMGAGEIILLPLGEEASGDMDVTSRWLGMVAN